MIYLQTYHLCRARLYCILVRFTGIYHLFLNNVTVYRKTLVYISVNVRIALFSTYFLIIYNITISARVSEVGNGNANIGYTHHMKHFMLLNYVP